MVSTMKHMEIFLIDEVSKYFLLLINITLNFCGAQCYPIAVWPRLF